MSTRRGFIGGALALLAGAFATKLSAHEPPNVRAIPVKLGVSNFRCFVSTKNL